jgi:hypothetical protein
MSQMKNLQNWKVMFAAVGDLTQGSQHDDDGGGGGNRQQINETLVVPVTM